MFRKSKTEVLGPPDWILLSTTLALIALGLMMVYSSTFDMAYLEYDNPNYFFHRQLVWLGLSVIVMIVIARIDYHLWQRWAILIMAGTLLMLGLVAVTGSEKFGASRWLWNGSIQPSEGAKVSVVIYIAAWVASKGRKIRKRPD